MAAGVAGAVAELAPLAVGVAAELGVRGSGAVTGARATGSSSANTPSVAADDVAELVAGTGGAVATAAAVDARGAGGAAADRNAAGSARRWRADLGPMPVRGAAGGADLDAGAVAARVRGLDVSRPGRGTVRRRSSSVRAASSSSRRRSQRSCAMTSFSATRGVRRVLRLMGAHHPRSGPGCKGHGLNAEPTSARNAPFWIVRTTSRVGAHARPLDDLGALAACQSDAGDIAVAAVVPVDQDAARAAGVARSWRSSPPI